MSDKELLGSSPSLLDPKDAVHVAITPVVIMYDDPKPGDKVDLQLMIDGTIHAHKPAVVYDFMAVLDPYIAYIYKRSTCYAMMRPGSIKTLRHEWTHPKLNTSKDKDEAVARLRAFAKSVERSYEIIMEGAENYVKHGSTVFGGSEFDCVDFPVSFWDDYEMVTGLVVEEKDRGYFFSCSC